MAVLGFFAVGNQQTLRAATNAQAIPGIGAWRISSYDTTLGESTLQLGRYSVAVESAWQAVPGSSAYLSPSQIHANSPATKVAMYAAGPDVESDCTTLLMEQTTCASGVGMFDINNGHPDWLLRDSSGNLLTNAGYPYYYIGDIGNAQFQQAWVANVAYRAKSLGFDGVSIDDIQGSYLGFLGGKAPAKYPTQAAWQTAMLSFVSYVVPALQAQGLYVGAEVFGSDDANVNHDNNNGSADAAWWKQVISASHLNGIFCEYFEQNPNNLSQVYDNTHVDWTDNWDGWLNLVDVAQGAGVDFWGLDYSTGTAATDQRNMTYGKASFLLHWNGKPSGAYFWQNRNGPSTGNNPWDPAWTMSIGTPIAPAYAVGTGAYRRDYSAGTVIVNPMPATQTLSLGGTYTTASGASVTSVTLGPTSAAILQIAPSTTPPSTTTTPTTTTATTPTTTTATTTAPTTTTTTATTTTTTATTTTTTPTTTATTTTTQTPSRPRFGGLRGRGGR